MPRGFKMSHLKSPGFVKASLLGGREEASKLSQSPFVTDSHTNQRESNSSDNFITWCFF